jgi:hypothetical protein
MRKYLFCIIIVALVSCKPTSLIKTSSIEQSVGEVYDFLKSYIDTVSNTAVGECFVEAEKWPIKVNSSINCCDQGIIIDDVYLIRDDILFASLSGRNKSTRYGMILIASDTALLFYKEKGEELIKKEDDGSYGIYVIGDLSYKVFWSPTIKNQIDSLTVYSESYYPYRIDTLPEMFDYSGVTLLKSDSITIRF